MRTVETVDAHQEAGERLARSRGGRDERVVARLDVGPALALGGGGAIGETAAEPLRHRRMEALHHGVGPRQIEHR